MKLLEPEVHILKVNEKLSQSAIRKMMKKYAVACHAKCEDVPLDLHAHQFRHPKASHWLEDGMNIAQISILLGHSQLETTMIYLDITTDQEAAALPPWRMKVTAPLFPNGILILTVYQPFAV